MPERKRSAATDRPRERDHSTEPASLVAAFRPNHLAPRSVRWRLVLYAAVAVAGTAMCFFLHYAGNQIPYDLAQQRFAEEFEESRVSRRYFGGEKPLFTYEFCQLSLAVMGGAYRYPGYRPLVDAVLPRSFGQESDRGYCAELQALSEGAESTLDWEKTRYWWGNKAVLAIGLRYLTVFDLHRLILIATYGAWLLLAAALALMGWRPLLVAAPAVVFGLAFSGIEYFSDVANGIPYLWSVLAAAMLAFLLRSPTVAQWAPLFCFITGMVSAYLWFFDGHTALAVALIGLVAWLGYERLEADGRTRRAAGCVALYVTGFVVCFGLGQVVKGIVKEWASIYSGWDVVVNLSTQMSYLLDRVQAETLVGTAEEGAELRACPGCGEPGWQKLPIVRDIRGFWLMTPLGMSADKVLSAFSALALAGAAVAAVRQVRQGRTKLAGGVLWLVALALLVSIHLFLPSDVPFRNPRLAFLLFATCWACLVLTMMQSSRKGSTILAGSLIGGLLVIVTSIHLAEAAEARRIEQAIANARPVVQSDFNVYLDGDNRLVYVKDECDDADVRQKFFLHLTPADHADLPEHRRQYTFDSLDFYFGNYGTLNGGRCIVRRPLPDYDIATVRTGQYVRGAGKIWEVRFPFKDYAARLKPHRPAYAAVVPGDFGGPAGSFRSSTLPRWKHADRPRGAV